MVLKNRTPFLSAAGYTKLAKQRSGVAVGGSSPSRHNPLRKPRVRQWRWVNRRCEELLELTLGRVRLEWQSGVCSHEALPTMLDSVHWSQCEAESSLL